MARKTRYTDRNNEPIYIGDIVFVEEYPDEYVGGSYSYEGVIEEHEGNIYCTYYDIGECEPLPLSMFPKKGRKVLTEAERKEYWRVSMLGAEPPEFLFKRDLYDERED